MVASYNNSTFMESTTHPPTEKVWVCFGRLMRTMIQLAVAARATGWAAFGIAEAGGMKGADMVVFETASNDIFDAHVLD